MKNILLSSLWCVGALAAPAFAQTPVAEAPVEIAVDTAAPVCDVPRAFYGIFIEDVNGAVDGGLYAELIKNRGFEFKNPLAAWNTFGDVSVRTDDPAVAGNPHYVRLYNRADTANPKPRSQGAFLENIGYWGGMGVRAGARYRVSFWARAPKPMTISVFFTGSHTSEPIAAAAKKIKVEGDAWRRYEAELTPSQTDAAARFVLSAESWGSVDVDFISVFPRATWKNRENGLRPDLAQALRDIGPKHFRFPGGCIIEGTHLDTRHRWKQTVGALEERVALPNMWGFYANRFVPDYYQSFGVGFYEYFLLAEDLGAEPLPILNCGMACQGAGRSCEVAPLDEMESYLQDALDLIEFANGAPDSKWGSVRAKMGHPQPFGLKMLGVGNENRGEAYEARLKLFAERLRAAHPEIEIVPTSGDTAEYATLNALIRELKLPYSDEHYYKSADWFFENAGKFDAYDRTGPKIYVGEYAVCPKQAAQRRSTFRGAMAEAAFMTGMERNCDVVAMAAYAPLFANVAATVWTPDMIYFNSLDRVLSTSYHVQRMFARNLGDKLVRISSPQTDLKGADDLYASATMRAKDGVVFLKIVNAAPAPRTVALNFKDAEALPEVGVTTLHSVNLKADNGFEAPERVAPVSRKETLGAGGTLTLEGNSVNVVRVQLKR